MNFREMVRWCETRRPSDYTSSLVYHTRCRSPFCRPPIGQIGRKFAPYSASVVLCRALELAIVIEDGKVDHPVVVNEGTRQLCLKERCQRNRYIMLDIPPTHGTAL